MKKLLLLFLFVLLCAAMLVACGGGDTTTHPSETTSPTSSEATVTTEAPVTTEALTENGIPLDKLNKVSTLPADKKFKEEGLQLMKLIIRDFYNTKTNVVLNGDGGATTLWAVGSFLEAVAATYKMYPEDEEIKAVYEGLLTTGLRKFKVHYRDNGYNGSPVNGVRPYYYNASAGNQGDYYYDDDLWIAIQYIEAYHALGKKTYLQSAQEILEFIWLGWGIWNGADKYDNGGIPWKVGTGPTTCSNAPGSYAFALFSIATDDPALKEEYLNRSKTVYDWTRKYMKNGSLYKDSFDNNWSGAYNNGLMIASGSVLYTLTGESTYRAHARATARAAFSNNIKYENDLARFNNDNDTVWMSAWLLKGWIEFYKIDDSNTTSFLDVSCEVMANALNNKLESGYLRERIHDLSCENSSTDTVNLGGGVTCLMILAEWAELYGKNYQ